MPIAEALAILDKDTGTAFDADCVAALKRGLARLTGSEEEPGPRLARPAVTG
jgi:HD-GYP domain-containing protein (c-di-GMP phosphodiesterase class II)